MDGIPQTLLYGGNEYRFISHAFDQMAYNIGTAYIFAVKSGENYYALGENLNPVALHFSDGALTAEAGVAEVVPEASGAQANFRHALPAKIGNQYLTVTALNGPLALSSERAFQWHFTSMYQPETLAAFYGSASETDTSTSGCLTFKDGAFGSTQWGNMTENNLLIYQKVCSHANRERHPAAAAACLTGGNAESSYCPDCGSWLDAGGEYTYLEGGRVCAYTEDSFATYPTGHHYVNGVCAYDKSHIAPEYESVASGDNLFEEGYLYVIATPDSGNKWKVMDFDSQQMPELSMGCSAVMGQDGKLRIDNTLDGTRSAAEFRITAFEDEENVLRRVPVGAQYGEYEWGLWAPDNGSDICRLNTDSGYMLMDQCWQPSFMSPHPYSIFIRQDGIAEIQMLTFSNLLSPIRYGATKMSWSGGEEEERICFYAPWDENDIGASVPVNARLFRAKVPTCTLNAQVQAGKLSLGVASDSAREAILAVGEYDAEGKMTRAQMRSVSLMAGFNQPWEEIPLGDAAECRVFLLDSNFRPLSVLHSVVK